MGAEQKHIVLFKPDEDLGEIYRSGILYLQRDIDVKIISSESDALEFFTQEKQGVVFVDLDFDRAAAFHFIDQLTLPGSPYTDVAIVTSTADGDPMLQQLMEHKGVYFHLVLPFSIDDLQHVVTSLVPREREH